MSDAPQGPSWFQAADGKWYPPPEGQQNLQSSGQTNPVLPARKRYPLVLGIAIPILIVSLIAGFAVARMLSSDDEATTVAVGAPGEIFLEPAAEIGADPFAPTPFAPPPDPALARPVGAAPVTTLPATTAAVQAYSGAQPGLYGGTRQNAVCNVQQMIDYLVANPSIAGAWVVAQNADPTLRFDKGVLTVADLPAYIATLTPLILLQDTRVTMSGYKNGQPTPHQSVLQKGGAVLVDKYGVPRAKCYCGNPLTAPEPATVAPIYVGPAWPDFNPAVVAVVTPSPNPINIFVTINIANGQTYNVPAGNNATASPPPPVATTAAPAPQTTAAPVATTAAPAPQTTAAPVATTAAPAPQTTAAPVATTAAPAPQTTAAPAPPPTGPAPPCGPPGPPGPSPSYYSYEPVSLAIGVPSWWSRRSVELRAGDKLYVGLYDRSGGMTDPELYIYDPCGNQIGNNDDASHVTYDAGLTVVVSDYGFYDIDYSSRTGAGDADLEIIVN